MTAALSSTVSRTKSRFKVWREVLEIVILTTAIFLAVRVTLQNFRVDGSSMFPSLHNGEYILVNKIDYMISAPQRGDVVVFKAVPALEPNKDFIKRVIGLPGETVAVHNGTVLINGNPISEPYITQKPAYTFGPARVPQNDYFVLGDNRNDSYDSAKWASTPWLARSDIVGKAWVAYWPPAHFSFFQTPSFASNR
jgi:signal peptidase I